MTDPNGVPWSGSFVNANGDLTVDLRSDIAAGSRAKIVYERLLLFTDDPHVRESLGFLMTRELAHMQMFTAALSTIQPNFPPGILQGDPRASHTYFNLSHGQKDQPPAGAKTRAGLLDQMAKAPGEQRSSEIKSATTSTGEQSCNEETVRR